jgi:hypothetical protein
MEAWIRWICKINFDSNQGWELEEHLEVQHIKVFPEHKDPTMANGQVEWEVEQITQEDKGNLNYL